MKQVGPYYPRAMRGSYGIVLGLACVLALANCSAGSRQRQRVAHPPASEAPHPATPTPGSWPATSAPAPTPAPARLPASPTPPSAFLPLSGIATDVAAGRSHGCALVAGSVYCWGKTDRWQVGRPPAAGVAWQAPSKVPSPPGADGTIGAVSIAAYGDTTCAVRADGTVFCWGELAHHSFAQRPRGVHTECNRCSCATHGTFVHGIDDAVQVAVGAEHACVLTREGQVRCWGDNRFGQLGLAHTRELPRVSGDPLSELAPVVRLKARKVFAGAYYSCALLDAGGVSCWGLDASGQLGSAARERCTAQGLFDPGVTCSSSPRRVSHLKNIAELSLGARHACAADQNGNVYCWGENSFAQLGSVSRPRVCNALDASSCSLPELSQDKVPCSNTPIRVSTQAPVQRLALFARESCALFDNRSYACWGDHRQLGQIPNPSKLDSLAGSKYQIAKAVVGSEFGVLLTQTGAVLQFNSAGVATIVAPEGVQPTAKPLAKGPAVSNHCSVPGFRLAPCPRQRDTLSIDEVLVQHKALLGKTISVQAVLWPFGSDAGSGFRTLLLREEGQNMIPTRPEMLGLIPRSRRQSLSCSKAAAACCSPGVAGRSVVATGVLQSDATSKLEAAYQLVDAEVCELE